VTGFIKGYKRRFWQVSRPMRNNNNNNQKKTRAISIREARTIAASPKAQDAS